MNRNILLALVVWLALGFLGTGFTQEHPKEHPKAPGAEHPKEHPAEMKKKAKEHPKEEPAKKPRRKAAAITVDDLAKAIENYVKKDAALKGGYFLVYDAENKIVLQLTLDHVHKERLSKVSEGVYFACADFKTPDGKVYDLDLFMKETEGSSLEPTEVSIHKEDGKARYGWVEEKGVWKKQK